MISKTDINNIIEKSLSQSISVISSHRIYMGGLNFVYEVATDKCCLIIKAYPKSRNKIANKEYSILKLIQSSNIDVPRGIAAGQYKDIGYIIYEKIEGKILCYKDISTFQQETISYGIVENIFQIFKLEKFSFYGNITEDNETFESWNDFLRWNVADGLKYLESSNLLNLNDFNTLSAYMGNHELLNSSFENRIGLVWSDFKQDNILIKNDNSITLLDFEACFNGDILLSLGYLFAKEGKSMFYKSITRRFENIFKFNADDVYFYAIFRLLRISKYLNTTLPTGLKREPILNYFPGIEESIRQILKKYE